MGLRVPMDQQERWTAAATAHVDRSARRLDLASVESRQQSQERLLRTGRIGGQRPGSDRKSGGHEGTAIDRCSKIRPHWNIPLRIRPGAVGIQSLTAATRLIIFPHTL